jgi:hypothetical protein
MLLSIDRLAEKGKYGMINMQSWMFLSSFESLRKIVIDDTHIDNMLHLGPRTFDELSGEVVQNTAFVITNEKPSNGGTYFRLVDGKDCGDKERMFIGAQKSLNGFEKNPIGKNNFSSMENSSSVQSVNQIRFDNVSQKDFYLLNGIPLSYWVSEQEFKAFDGNSSLGEIAEPRAGLQTSDNPRFLRLWFEVSTEKVSYNLSREEALSSDYKWFPHNKGGSKRRWYGNRDYIINFYHDGEELKYWLEHNPNDPTTKSWSRNLRNYPLYFKEGITWSAVSSNSITFRYTPKGSTFDTSGPMLFFGRAFEIYLRFSQLKSSICFCKNIFSGTFDWFWSHC